MLLTIVVRSSFVFLLISCITKTTSISIFERTQDLVYKNDTNGPEVKNVIADIFDITSPDPPLSTDNNVNGTTESDLVSGRKCLVYEDIVTEAPEVIEDVQIVLFYKSMPGETQVKYGQNVIFQCNIYSDSSINIRWYGRSKTFKSGPSDDGGLLWYIKSVDTKLHGEYITCEASSVSNQTLLRTFGTNVVISDLASPLISEATITDKDNTTLSCKIVSGVPSPQMSWQVKKNGDTEFRMISTKGENLTIDSSTFENDGQYKCIATNVVDNATKTFDLVVHKSPVILIEEESNKTFPYGNTIEFNCNINGYPLPKSVWTDDQGNKLDFEDVSISWHEKISKLKLQGMKKSNNYSCFAESILGKAVSSVNVTVLSPFIVHEYPKETTDIHYGQSTHIICNITSSFRLTIKWFRPTTANSSNQSEIHTGKNFKITSDETTLQIIRMDLDMVGTYKCEAALVSDKNEIISFQTNLQIDDLSLPLLNDKNKIVVMETNWITLYCKIIGGIPRPTLSWQVMRNGKKVYENLSSSSEELDVHNITISDAGTYQCVAKNAMGERVKVTEVVVRKAPVTTIDKGSSVTVAYGSNNTFTCRVVAYPLPSIAWNDSSANKLTSKETLVHEHDTTSEITVSVIRADNTYQCNATNSLGHNASSITVTVLSPFVVHQYPDVTTNAHYLESTRLVCNITSSFPLNIKWYHNMSEVHTSGKHIISANETVLHINGTDLELVGNYTCEATLVTDKNQHIAFSTDLKINNLRAPVITHYNGDNISVKKFEDMSLICKARGVPEPVVKWQAQLYGSSSFTTIGEGESICSTNVGSDQVGTYKCTATNIVGEDTRTINVSVL